MVKQIEFSIITPTLNSADVIADCMGSIDRQRRCLEHLVVDGKSTDGTRELVQRTGATVQVLCEPATGIYPAVNLGIQASRGDIIGILHADDFYPAANILEQVSAVFENPSVDACYGDLCYVGRSDTSRVVRYWRAGEFRPGRFKNGWMPPHPTFFVRRKIHEKYGLYRTDLGTAADYELMLRFLLRHGVSVAYLPQVLVNMRTGGASNVSLKARMAANKMDRRAWMVNDLYPWPWTTIVKPLRKIGQWWSKPVGS